MGFLDKVKSQAEQAATKAREGIEDVQTKRELGQALDELGRKTLELLDSGELDHPALKPLADRVRELQKKLDEDDAAEPAEATAGSSSETPPTA
jgi:CRISPR/Cas system type I-B associated protein Csh2 (Cas7 group RAMP superfamily)